MEEQGLVKPRPRIKSRRNRPKSLHREDTNSLSKGSTTRKNRVTQFLFQSRVQCLHLMSAQSGAFDITFTCDIISVCAGAFSLYFTCVHTLPSSERAHVCCAGDSLKVSMLIKAKCSAAGGRGGEPSNLLCMM